MEQQTCTREEEEEREQGSSSRGSGVLDRTVLLSRVGEVLEEAVRRGELEEVYRRQVRNVYVFGSRVHGTHKPDADYDLIAVVDGPYYEGPKLIEQGDINVNLYHRRYFSLMLKECLIWCLLVLYLPQPFILKEEAKLEWQMRKINVRKSALIDSKHNWHKAKRCWREGDIYKAKKNILHGLRYLQFAIQLLEKGAIFDLKSANHYWEEILGNKSEDWLVYESKYKPIYEDLTKRLDQLAIPLRLEDKKTRGRRRAEFDNALDNGQLRTIEYIQTFGLNALTRELSILITVHSEYPQLYHLCADKLDSPQDEQVVRECAYGLILERSDNDEWRPVALPYIKYFSHYRLEALPTIDRLSWSSARVMEKVDGAIAVLYWYGDKWHVSSWESPDGSEELISVLTDDGVRYYYSPRPGYNPWKFFEAKLEWTYATEKFEEDRTRGYYPNQVASILASNSVNVKHEHNTFADLFWSVWRHRSHQLPPADGPSIYNEGNSQPSAQIRMTDHIFMFSLCSDRHSLVLAHRDHRQHDEAAVDCGVAKCFEERVVLHGVRNMLTLKEEINIAKFASIFGCELPHEVQPPAGAHFNNLQEVVSLSLDLDPMELSGFVIVDERFNRLKVKSPAHRALDKLCWRSDDEGRANTLMLDVVRTNNHTSFLNRFPQWRSLYESVKTEWSQFVDDVEAAYKTIPWPTLPTDDAWPGAGSGAQSEAKVDAACVQQVKQTGLLSPVLFKMWHRQCSAAEVLRDYPQHLLLRMLRAWKRKASTTTTITKSALTSDAAACED